MLGDLAAVSGIVAALAIGGPAGVALGVALTGISAGLTVVSISPNIKDDPVWLQERALTTSEMQTIDAFVDSHYTTFDYLSYPGGRTDSQVNSCTTSALNWTPRRDPLVLDLDGDGFELVGASSLLFDHNADGIKTGTIQCLGVAASRSRPAVSNDNPYSEALFRTLKYRPQLPVKPFNSLLQARHWVTGLVHWYNHEHRRSAILFITPAQRHLKLDQAILAERAKVYAAARNANPNRWAGGTRNLSPITEVHLNPQTPKDQNQPEKLVSRHERVVG